MISSILGRSAVERRWVNAGETNLRSLRCSGPNAVNILSTATHACSGHASVISPLMNADQC